MTRFLFTRRFNWWDSFWIAGGIALLRAGHPIIAVAILLVTSVVSTFGEIKLEQSA